MSNHNYSWQYSSPQRTQQDGQPPPTVVNGRVVENGHRLLAVYPPASATPVHHVAAHMGDIRTSSAPTFPTSHYGGSYPPSHSQVAYNSSPPHGNPPPPYSEYDSRLQYLAQQKGPSLNDSGYWENSRNDAVRILNEHAGPSYPYRDSTPAPAPSQWTPQSSYQTTPFAQTVFQRTTPSSAYPTPPPPGINLSSSSLAFALGAPPTVSKGQPQPQTPRHEHGAVQASPAHMHQHQHGQGSGQSMSQQHLREQHQPQRMYQPQEALAYYEDFLDKKTKQINRQHHTQHQVQHQHPPQAQYSSSPVASNYNPYSSATHQGNQPQHHQYSNQQRPSIPHPKVLQTPVHNSSLPPKPGYTQTPVPGPSGVYTEPHYQSAQSQHYPRQHQSQTTAQTNRPMHGLPQRPPSIPSQQHASYHPHIQAPRSQDNPALSRPPSAHHTYQPSHFESLSRQPSLQKPAPNSLSYSILPSISNASGSTSIFPPIKRPITPPSKLSAPDSSPDPLALRSGGDSAPESIPIPMSSIKSSAQQNDLDMGTVTPRKRKPVVEILTPSKRVHLMKSGSSSSIGSVGSNQQSTPSLSQNSIPPKTPTSQARSSVPITPSTSHSQLSQSTSGPPNSMRSESSIPSSEGSVPTTPFFKRIKNNAYVSITPRAYLTPKTPGSSKRMKLDSDDLGGYGDDDGYGDEDAEGDEYEDSMAGSPIKRAHGVHDSAVKGSARRTGDRDSRNPLEKLISLIEDIFEAEDTLPPGSEAESLEELKNHEFFSPQSRDPSRPMLNASIVRKLTKYIGYVARPGKRANIGSGTTNGVTPRTVGAKGKGRMGDVETQTLGRLLKILERGVKVGEDLEGFPNVPSSSSGAGGEGSTNKSPTKRGAKKGGKTAKKDKETERRSRSRTPKDDEGVAMDEDQPSGSGTVSNARSRTPTEEDHEKLADMLQLARDSILSAECVIAVLGSDRLPKQLYSEELIISCLAAIKNQLTKILYPFVEASSSILLSSSSDNASLNTLSPLLLSVLKSSNSPHRPLIQGLYQALSATLPRITGLVNSENVAMSDTIIISGVYIAIGPFFIADGGDSGSAGKKDKEGGVVGKTLGKSAMRALRLDALSLIRSIFANHENQRSWIIEEILTSLIKLNDTKQKAGQFRLRDGRAIRTVSALLLQLVQTSAHDVRIGARKIERARQNQFALKRQESMSEFGGKPVEEPFLDENDHDELKLYSTSLESASKAAKTIIVFLTQRSGKGKATKNSNEAEYRAILDNLIEDLLVVLFWPEWPAAGLILGIMMKFMVTSLDDVKTNSQTDSNAAKQMALEHLGIIAAKIRTSKLKFQKDAGAVGAKPLKALDDVVSSISMKSLHRFFEAHQSVASHLCKQSSEDQAYESARELTAAMFGYELASALKNVHKAIENPEDDDDLDIKDTKKLQDFGTKLKIALREVWKDPSTDVFNVGSQEEAQRIDGLSEELGTIQSLRNSFNPILNVVLGALDAPAIFMRTKALKALGQMVMSDASILSAPNVRRGIESHLLDSSPQVRDAAVELIGKYMIDTPEVAGDYYSKIADRMADTGLGVRKRVIKLLKSFYPVAGDTNRKTDIATRLVLRMLDEDDTVKDLAIKSIEEMWFPPMPLPSALKSRSQTTNTNNPHDKSALLAKVSIIMGTAANFKDRQSPLEDVLHKIMKDKEGVERNSLHARYGEICEALIDGLVDASDLPGFTVANCVRTIHLLTSAYPSVLSATNASTLLPYLKNPTTPEELMASDYLLKIFRVSVPHLPKTAAKFGQELQTALQPMIIKPSSAGGVQILQETVSCMCIVVQHLTHDFVRLINLLKSCNARLQQMIKRKPGEPLNSTDLRTSVVLIFIVSLLAEHCKFDHLRKERPELAPDLNIIAQGSIIEHVYLTLLTLYEKFDNATLRARVLQCLGFLFRAQPTLMTMERSALIMDEIFASPDEDAKGRLLRIIQEFLISESEKHTALEKESSKGKGKAANVNMEELVGNTDGFADSGVSSAIVQRYLDHVLEAALSQNTQIQAVAIDVLSFTVKQGLAHPLQSFPVIVALETSTVVAISSRASALHAVLHGKHSSLLNARYMASARMTFDYQKKIATGSVQGFRMQPTPIALLQRWYSHIREKRTTRQDFLKALVKVFQESESFESSQDDVNYTRYMAENFASFDYKTQEEVFTVIKFLTNILSTTGTQLLEVISPSHLLTHLHPSSQQQPVPQTSTNEAPSDVMDVVPAPQPDKADVKQDRPALMRTSVVIAMVMLLKAHLKALYSLSEEKCLKFVVGKKTAIGDKPVTKRNDNPISWARLSFATTPLLTTEDADAQKIRFLEIWNEDGATAEPEDEEFL